MLIITYDPIEVYWCLYLQSCLPVFYYLAVFGTFRQPLLVCSPQPRRPRGTSQSRIQVVAMEMVETALKKSKCNKFMVTHSAFKCWISPTGQNLNKNCAHAFAHLCPDDVLQLNKIDRYWPRKNNLNVCMPKEFCKRQPGTLYPCDTMTRCTKPNLATLMRSFVIFCDDRYM